MITEKTRRYWLNALRGWAEDRLSPPQFDQCCAALDAMIPTFTADELPPEHTDILWWFPKGEYQHWNVGMYNEDKEHPPGCLRGSGNRWYLCNGPTWWMYPPADPTGETNGRLDI